MEEDVTQRNHATFAATNVQDGMLQQKVIKGMVVT